jgi:hypothetical protein
MAVALTVHQAGFHLILITADSLLLAAEALVLIVSKAASWQLAFKITTLAVSVPLNSRPGGIEGIRVVQSSARET